ncbi:hypothetical protein V1478_017146 [Vespula squamosa]|uniref:Uncharacterized protein n=1 Tax=Vespula squamosa TaxID=30214 RepID=A0ABD1ZYK0_VESSQ
MTTVDCQPITGQLVPVDVATRSKNEVHKGTCQSFEFEETIVNRDKEKKGDTFVFEPFSSEVIISEKKHQAKVRLVACPDNSDFRKIDIIRVAFLVALLGTLKGAKNCKTETRIPTFFLGRSTFWSELNTLRARKKLRARRETSFDSSDKLISRDSSLKIKRAQDGSALNPEEARKT